jgi:hypothetical protein
MTPNKASCNEVLDIFEAADRILTARGPKIYDEGYNYTPPKL